MQALLALVRADLVLYFSNRRAVLIGLAAPILIAAFFGSLFGGSGTQKPARVPVAVVDADRSALSTAVVAALRADPALALQELDADSAAQRVRDGKLRAAVTLPAGFGEAAGAALFGAGPKPELALAYDPSQAMALALVRGVLAQHVMQATTRDAFGGGATMQRLRGQALADPALAPAQRDALVQLFHSVDRVGRLEAAAGTAPRASGAASAPGGAAGGLSLPYRLAEQPLAAQGAAAKYNGYAHSFGGMGVQFILLMGVDGAVALLLMRRTGLWPRLRAAPLSRALLLGSRMASSALIALILFTLIWAVAMAVFGVRVHGSWAGFALLLATFAVLTASFGLLVAALGRSPEATRGLAILATLLLVMLGGAWVPSFVFPEWLQTLSLAVPTRWAVDGFDAMTWRGLGLDAAWAPAGAMLAFSAGFMALALWRFDWEE